jgi:prepilin-type N-terminal cleavage/methylation domain-containing protein
MMWHCCTPNPRPGFSLTELVVVVLVMAIVGAAALPMIGRTDGHKLRAVADQFTADLHAAQLEAMSHSDAFRGIDFYHATGDRYDLVNTCTSNNPAGAEILENPTSKQPWSVSFGQGVNRATAGVWLAKSNLHITGHPGHIDLGIYGNVTTPDVNPRLLFAVGDSTLGLTIDRDTGRVTIDSTFGDLANINAAAMPGPAGNVLTVATSPY